MTSPDETFRYSLLVLESLKREDAFHGLPVKPDDVEVIPSFDGSADRIEAWLIFGSAEEARAAAGSAQVWNERAATVIAASGFADAGLDSLVIRFTSWAEIENGGGRRAFFR